MSESRVRVSLTDGTFEFEGSEGFVAAHVEKFARVIQAVVAVQWPGSADVEASSPSLPAETASVAPPPPEIALADIYAATVDGVQILKRVPGSSYAQRTVNGATLYLYGLRMLKQRDIAWFREIKSICKAQNCYDSHNMSAYLKAAQHAFVFGGNGKRQTIQLSVPGLNAAAQLLANVRAGNDAMYRRRKRISR